MRMNSGTTSLTFEAATKPRGQSHAPGQHSGGEVSVIAARHDDDGTVAARGLPPLAITVEIVERLWNPAQQVDRIGRRHPSPLAERGVGEQLLHEPLAIVERSGDAQRMDVAAQGGHLALLQAADLPFGIEHHDLDARHIVKPVRHGAARIARGGRENHQFFIGGAQQACHPAHEPGAEILEGAGRTVEQFQRIASPADHAQGTGKS